MAECFWFFELGVPKCGNLSSVPNFQGRIMACGLIMSLLSRLPTVVLWRIYEQYIGCLYCWFEQKWLSIFSVWYVKKVICYGKCIGIHKKVTRKFWKDNNLLGSYFKVSQLQRYVLYIAVLFKKKYTNWLRNFILLYRHEHVEEMKKPQLYKWIHW